MRNDADQARPDEGRHLRIGRGRHDKDHSRAAVQEPAGPSQGLWSGPAESAVVIAVPPPAQEVDGWRVSAASPTGSLRLADCSPAVKFALQAEPAGGMAAQLAVEPGQVKQFSEGLLVACSAPGEWLLLAPGDAGPFLRRLRAAAPGEHLAAVDITHGRTLLRLTGPSAAEVISTLCAADLSDRGFPPGSATYAPVAGVRTGILRDDVSAEEAGWPPLDDGDAEVSGAPTPAAQGTAASAPVPSYLLHCDRSLGRHLHDELVWAGKQLGLEIEGFAPYRARRSAV